MPSACKVTANYLGSSPELSRYFAGIFHIEITVRDGGSIEDIMFPDWATMRFNQEPVVAGETRDGGQIDTSIFTVSGPRSQEVYIRTGTIRQWGVLIHPLGWALLVGEPAHEYANRSVDGMQDPAFEKFRPLAKSLFARERDPQAELRRLTDFFRAMEPFDEPAEKTIAKVYEALFNREIDSVAKLADEAGLNRRSLERLCRRTFGFPPKLLLRRQRFMRSLTDFTVDPSLKWIGALDASYHDQAQFVRDFRYFMGMTPTEYGNRHKPVIESVIRERARYGRERLWNPGSVGGLALT
ncbi:AraC family transcriptional regulator [Novosphingobium malaysiense]|uniref:AraC family transcriptional regulator n=1 Tax=Novosphingobium malaysiense TaxID=1348853 RepID=UPI00068D6BA1|nr:helix-turn-helix domain-containing protein [Novosphingobium malaysiense]